MKFLIFFFIFKVVLLAIIQTLDKYSSISTKEKSILFFSREFPRGAIIYFKLEIIGNSQNMTCRNTLRYEFFEDSNEANPNYAKYSTIATSSQNNGATRIFEINKNSEHLNGNDGSYLLLIIDCDGSVTITNFEKSTESSDSGETALLVVEIILGIFFVVVTILLCYGCINGDITKGDFCCCLCQCLCMGCFNCPTFIPNDNRNISYSKDKGSSQGQNEQNNNNSVIKEKNKNVSQSFSSDRSNANQIKNPIIIINVQQNKK